MLRCFVVLAFVPALCAGPPDRLPDVIAFGSCAKQTSVQPAWEKMLVQDPDLFIFTGDNVYADTHDPQKLRDAYALLDAKPGFQKLREHCPVLATWDDHDYGLNDEGGDNPNKMGAQAALLDFLGVPENSPRREREGIYDARVFESAGRRLQVLTLDTRYFRSPLMNRGGKHRYVPDSDPEKTVLGAAQWKWLEEKLREPADLRIIASSIQVIPEQHPFEKWGNFPLEKQRLFDLVRSTGANGVIFISGDRHMSEISEHKTAIGYPLVEVTSSGMTQAGGGGKEENASRVGSIYRKRNYGVIMIDWNAAVPTVAFAIRDAVNGGVVVEHQVKIAELKPEAS